MIAIDTRDFCIPSDENDYDELVAFADTIAGIQTHEVIPIGVLDKIRAEIEDAAKKFNMRPEISYDTAYSDGLYGALSIIDKYREQQAEGSGEE